MRQYNQQPRVQDMQFSLPRSVYRSSLSKRIQVYVGRTAVTLWALGIYFVVVLLLVIAMLVVSYLLGQRHHEHSTVFPYESGIVSEGSAHVRLSAKFYLVAMFFVVFDLEAVFIFAWAIAGRELGWPGYWAILIFTGVLIVALAYLWRLGALDWGESRHHSR